MGTLNPLGRKMLNKISWFMLINGLSALAASPLAIAQNLESPAAGSFQSGIGLIRGWACDARTVEVLIDNRLRLQVAYGTTRPDTLPICGDDNNGFGLTFNWNTLGTGSHQLQALVDGVPFANVSFTVTTLGSEFLRGASGETSVAHFPQSGQTALLRWSEPDQNFVIVGFQGSPSCANVAGNWVATDHITFRCGDSTEIEDETETILVGQQDCGITTPYGPGSITGNQLNISVQNLGSFSSMTLASVDGTYNGAMVNSSRVELNGSGNATATNAGQPVACTWNATGVWSR